MNGTLLDTSDIFQSARVDGDATLPPFDSRIIDVAILDMNHVWVNLGHDSLVEDIRIVTSSLASELRQSRLAIRVLSFDIRHARIIPEGPGDRFLLYIGTGGPGHLDPRHNVEGGPLSETQGVSEQVAWEPELWTLFDAIRQDPRAALIGVCHTFGLLCRWAGIAVPVRRSGEKGGKSSGVVENELTDEALRHPYFSGFASELPDGRRCRVLDNRLFDLLPQDGIDLRDGVTVLAREVDTRTGRPGDAITMVEFARETGQQMPRMLGVNHHPEVYDRRSAFKVLREKFEQGDITSEWYRERAEALSQEFSGVDLEALLRLTSQYTLFGPMQHHLQRIIRSRAAMLDTHSLGSIAERR